MKRLAFVALIALAACSRTPTPVEANLSADIQRSLPNYCAVTDSTSYGNSAAIPNAYMTITIECDTENLNALPVSGDQSSGSNSEGR